MNGNTELKIFNTLTRRLEPFIPIEPGKVGIYLCGPTVYKPSHVGHMVGPVIFDSIKRYLKYLGFQVTFIVNITDIDDKLIKEAPLQNLTVASLAEKITQDYWENLKKLQVTQIDQFPKATHHIQQIIEMIQGLIDRGYAYPMNGDVYFDISKDSDYGKLCNRDPEQLEAGARIEVNAKKKNPGDFALWKSAKPGEPSWTSPWGEGRPGWHIECSAMSRTLLGDTIDIHGGGLDLQFPHHENELAQSESFTQKPFARYWMHNGLMKTGNKKMSKSEGNEIVVTELLKRHHPETLRFLLLNTHYRSPIEYSEDRLRELRRALDSYYRFFDRYQRICKESFYHLEGSQTKQDSIIQSSKNSLNRTLEKGTEKIDPTNPVESFLQEIQLCYQQFTACLNEDFNTGGAIGILFDLSSILNRFADQQGLETHPDKIEKPVMEAFKQGTLLFRELSQILGLFIEPVSSANTENTTLLDGLIQLALDLRQEARKNKNFAQADQIRKRLTELGVVLEDRAGGTDWRIN